MGYQKFDLAKLERLNDPERFTTLPPDVMWRALGEPEARVIVEVGAGTGIFASAFAERAPMATVYAADIEPAMVEWMASNRPEVTAGRIIPLLAEETRVPLDDGVADIVIMVNLHHELVDPAASYAEARRLLRAGGQLLVVDWAPGDSPHGPSQAIRAEVMDVARLLERSGFGAACVHHGALPYAWLVTAQVRD